MWLVVHAACLYVPSNWCDSEDPYMHVYVCFSHMCIFDVCLLPHVWSSTSVSDSKAIHCKPTHNCLHMSVVIQWCSAATSAMHTETPPPSYTHTRSTQIHMERLEEICVIRLGVEASTYTVIFRAEEKGSVCVCVHSLWLIGKLHLLLI